MEIERKFLPAGPVPELPARFTRMRQGYLATGPEREVRLRDADGSCTLSVKSGAGRVRAETEVAITSEQFEALWPLTAGLRVEKRRYRVPEGGLLHEIDVYEGALEGLVVVEVEFESAHAADAFVPPAYFGTEITDDPRYKNASLAAEGMPIRPTDAYPLS